MKYILSLIAIAMSSMLSYAQTDTNAKNILDKTIEKIKSYPAVEIVFDMAMENKAENIHESYEGKAYIKEKMYKIEIMDQINYFDGETIYTYMPDAEEVTVKLPDEDQEPF